MSSRALEMIGRHAQDQRETPALPNHSMLNLWAPGGPQGRGCTLDMQRTFCLSLSCVESPHIQRYLALATMSGMDRLR